jgi:hypothetical protein
MITADRAGQLAAALDVSNRVFAGHLVPLATMCVAREVIDSHTNAKATVALLGTYIDARRAAIRAEADRAAKRGTIRRALLDGALFAAFALAVVVVGLAL